MRSERTVSTRSGPIAYLEDGTEPVALFVHGVGTSSHLWRNVIAGLSGERRCLALDLPLHGGSPARPGQDLSLGALADVVEDFCAALGLTRVDLVANDTGGAVAQIFAARHHERLRTLTLTNCEVHDNVPPEEFKPAVEAAKAGSIAPTAARFIDDPDLARTTIFGTGYENPAHLDDQDLLAYLGPVFGTPDAAREFERLLASLAPDDLLAAEPELRKLDVPTLVVWGTGDTTFDVRWAHWLRDTIPGVTEVVEIEGGKLFFPDERAGDLIPHLRRHWDAYR